MLPNTLICSYDAHTYGEHQGEKVTDFLSLPGNTVPMDHEGGPLGPGGTAPLDGSTDGGGVVRFTSPEWRWRASVAAEGADQLRAAADLISDVAINNYFGECVEGREMHIKAMQITSHWRLSISNKSNELMRLSSDCQDADTTLETADKNNGAILQG